MRLFVSRRIDWPVKSVKQNGICRITDQITGGNYGNRHCRKAYRCRFLWSAQAIDRKRGYFKRKFAKLCSLLDNCTLRVAAYCRVSRSEEDQLNSFITQMHYYHDFISQSDNMVLVDIYADEGITGTSVEKRNEFKRMLNDCRLGKIDRIYVKNAFAQSETLATSKRVSTANRMILENPHYAGNNEYPA